MQEKYNYIFIEKNSKNIFRPIFTCHCVETLILKTWCVYNLVSQLDPC